MDEYLIVRIRQNKMCILFYFPFKLFAQFFGFLVSGKQIKSTWSIFKHCFHRDRISFCQMIKVFPQKDPAQEHFVQAH